ncbi:Ribonuclease H-like superfamily [Arabidopsis thaliana x Arabidopsis arenosa]|uniref:Ribonuclease H-like superfamily n=1 Tax=Arabidopsis thaliana x Arabidopsis arenosa TaxID=1240361 RepID=A0A8T2B0M9_9BRAS|nr:Ribonuclease H-like superfamily [Arabidopsis thaliana x Arabidopsis arenosa]
MDDLHLKQNSDDMGWEYGVLCDPKNPDKVKCKLCGKEMSGGVFRMKEHIGHQRGNVSPCPLSTKEDQAKCMSALKEAKHKKTRKRRHDEELRLEVIINKPYLDNVLQEELGTQTAPHFQGRPMDKFVNYINPEASLAAQTRQQNIHAAIFKEKTNAVRQYCARWMYQSSCAAHTIDLMLEGVSKFPWFAKVISQAKALTVFLYVHHKTLSMMRAHTKKRDIVTPGATRFATCFFTLQSLHEKKSQLMSMFGSDEWHECKHSKCVKGKQASDKVMSYALWSSVIVVLKVFNPMVKVLRLADGEKKPPTRFIYGEILEAKKSIKEASNHLEKNYKPIFQIMDEKMKGRLDSPLHLAAYFLNPFYFYKDPNIQYDMEMREGFIACVETFYHGDFEKQNKGIGGQHMDAMHAPTLQKLATRILALTSCSSGCERNWSSFEAIHTKKRNILDVNSLNSLVYVQINARLFNKHKKMKEKAIDVIIDDGNEETIEDWIVEEHQDDQATVVGVVPNTQSPRVRELYDDDFESKEADEVMLEMEFEPDVFHKILNFVTHQWVTKIIKKS